MNIVRPYLDDSPDPGRYGLQKLQGARGLAPVMGTFNTWAASGSPLARRNLLAPSFRSPGSKKAISFVNQPQDNRVVVQTREQVLARMENQISSHSVWERVLSSFGGVKGISCSESRSRTARRSGGMDLAIGNGTPNGKEANTGISPPMWSTWGWVAHQHRSFPPLNPGIRGLLLAGRHPPVRRQ